MLDVLSEIFVKETWGEETLKFFIAYMTGA